ncbi:MAG: acetyl-CoA carboxylase biotin carboxyl carrier protein [Vicingaceae bacterium]
MKISEIQDLIKFVAKSGVSQVELESEGFKLVIKTSSEKKIRGRDVQTAVYQTPMQMHSMPMQSPPAQPTPQPAAPAAKAEVTAPEVENANYVTVKSPMIGTFYRKPSPDKPVFVNVGDAVEEGQTVCVIEAMKLFNEIESEVSGKIIKVLVEDNSPVEYDQPLFLIEPA